MKLYTVFVLLGVCAFVTAQLEGSVGMNPMNMYLWMNMWGDPNMKSVPLMAMMMRDPSMMTNPLGAYLISSLMGVDLNKVAAPLAMYNGMSGGSSIMRWIPMLMGDPTWLSLLYSMGGTGGTGGGGMNALG